MEHDNRDAQWSTVLTGLGLGSLAIGASGFPTNRAHLERALITAWSGWSGSGAYRSVLPRDFSIYAMRSTMIDALGYVTWEWRHGIRPVLAVESADAADVLAQFAADQPVSASEWEDLARRVSAEPPSPQ